MTTVEPIEDPTVRQAWRELTAAGQRYIMASTPEGRLRASSRLKLARNLFNIAIRDAVLAASNRHRASETG